MNLKINSTSIFYILLHFNAGFDIPFHVKVYLLAFIN